MRSNRDYSLREKMAFLRHFILSRLSLFYFKFISGSRITFVRDGGIGDAIMASDVISQFNKKFPKARIQLMVEYPELYKVGSPKPYTFFSFPSIRLSYGHYDLKALGLKPRHIRSIMRSMAGITSLESSTNLAVFEGMPTAQPSNMNYQLKTRYAVIQPEVGDWFKEKNWEVSKWNDLIQMLLDDFEFIYQIGTSQESVLNGIVDLRGKTSIMESCSLIKHASFFLGVNSFGEQAAGSFSVPSVVLYGPTNPVYSTNPGQVALFGFKGRYVFGEKYEEYNFPRMSEIESARVYSEVKTLIGK